MPKKENKRNYEQKTKGFVLFGRIFFYYTMMMSSWWTGYKMNAYTIPSRTECLPLHAIMTRHFVVPHFHFNYHALRYGNGIFLHSSLTPWHYLEGVRWELWLRSAHDAYIIQFDTSKRQHSDDEVLRDGARITWRRVDYVGSPPWPGAAWMICQRCPYFYQCNRCSNRGRLVQPQCDTFCSSEGIPGRTPIAWPASVLVKTNERLFRILIKLRHQKIVKH